MAYTLKNEKMGYKGVSQKDLDVLRKDFETVGIYPAEPNKLSRLSRMSIEQIFMHEYSHCRDYTDMQRIAGELIELVMSSQDKSREIMDARSRTKV